MKILGAILIGISVFVMIAGIMQFIDTYRAYRRWRKENPK